MSPVTSVAEPAEFQKTRVDEENPIAWLPRGHAAGRCNSQDDGESVHELRREQCWSSEIVEQDTRTIVSVNGTQTSIDVVRLSVARCLSVVSKTVPEASVNLLTYCHATYKSMRSKAYQ